MRSYYAHLDTVKTAAEGAISPRPTFRSSAIFPVMQSQGISSRILFLGYWILKRHIREIAAVISLRDSKGTLMARETMLITEAKTFSVELGEALKKCGWREENFTGSMEIEFFSTQNLFFPYPAVVINYYGPQFSTVVHTAQRVYNDFDDMQKNNQTQVPESGFNIYADEQREPFFGLINGSMPVRNALMHMQFINKDQAILQYDLELGDLNPYETRVIYPAQHCGLHDFLGGKPGAGKIQFNVNWIFPRLLVGNIHHDIPAVTITHTYYDCTEAKNSSDYWRTAEPGWHVASLMVPAFVKSNHFTNIYFYPIYSPSRLSIDIELYNEAGTLLGSKSNVLTVISPCMGFHKIEIAALCNELSLPPNQNYAARLIARPLDNSPVPARIKIGLDIGKEISETPCNICTNLQPFNPSLEGKPSSFRWTPFLADQAVATVWIMNSSPAVHYQRSAELTLTFFHEKDTQTLVRSITLPPNGFKVLSIRDDEELKSFFDGRVGWMTATTSNPYTTTYYFAETPAGVVGGDHGF